MNILHIADVLSMGGLETYIATLLNGLSKDNNVHLISQYMSAEMRIALNDKVNWIEQKEDSGIYTRYIMDNNIDIIHCHPYDALRIGSSIGQFLNIPVVFTYHGLWGWNYNHHVNVKKIIAVSNEVHDIIIEKDPKMVGYVEIIQNGIDTSNIFQKECNCENTVLFIGRIDIDKYYSIQQIISALTGLNVKLIVAGNGSHYDKLKSEVPEWVELLGYVNEMNDVINNSNIVFATGRGIRESMICGKPCISLDACYYDGIVNHITVEEIERCNFSGRSKYKVPINPEVIKRDVEFLLDKNIQHEIGEWSREYAIKNYTSDVFVEKHMQLYKQVKGEL